MTVWNPPPPSRHAALSELVYGEPEAAVPGIAELLSVLWGLNIRPQLQLLPTGYVPPASPNRQAAIGSALAAFRTAQWAYWPLGDALEERVRGTLETHFDELFEDTAGGFLPRWQVPGAEILITWEVA